MTFTSVAALLVVNAGESFSALVKNNGHRMTWQQLSKRLLDSPQSRSSLLPEVRLQHAEEIRCGKQQPTTTDCEPRQASAAI
jgi:uncharacterized protein YfdQ (DUF2303 family)